MLNTVQCLRSLLSSPLVTVPVLSAASSLSRTRKDPSVPRTQPTNTAVRSFTLCRSTFGREAHGVTQEASLPPGGTKDAGKVQPVPEDEREPLADSASPLDVYNWRVRYHDLSPDPHQEAVIEYLLKCLVECLLDQ